MRSSVLVAVLLVSLGCQRTPAQSQTSTPPPGKTGSSGTPPAGQTGQKPAQPGQPAVPGQLPADGAKPAAKPVPAQLPEVLARVGEETISKAEFERAVRMVEARVGQPVPVERRDEVYRRILEQMIDLHLLSQEARVRNITVTDADLDGAIGKIRQQFKTEEEFTKALASRSITLEELKTETRKEMVVAKTLEAEILPKVSVQQTDLETYYKENQEQFKQPEQIRASHILIGVDAKATDPQKTEARAVADGLLKRAKSGEDFAALAKQYSKDSGSAVNGGDLNFFPRGKMVPAFETAAFALKPGEISEVVETPFGYHIIKLTERKPESIVPLADVSTKLSDVLKRRKQQELAGQFVQSLRTKYKVEVLI